MKATGIVRRIDELGRIVIPKEIRRIFRIKEGDSLEIFTSHNGEIILKKYSPFEELEDFAQAYCDAIWQNTGNIAIGTDKERYIACSGKKDIKDKSISTTLEKIIDERGRMAGCRGDSSFLNLIEDDDITAEAVAPIISAGDAVGAVVVLNKDNGKKFGDVENKMVQIAASFLGKHLE